VSLLGISSLWHRAPQKHQEGGEGIWAAGNFLTEETQSREDEGQQSYRRACKNLTAEQRRRRQALRDLPSGSLQKPV